MPVDPKFIVNLKGKDYPTWPGILDAAWREGLLKLEVTPIQNPNEGNGWTAIALARAEFKDGRVFQEMGDCNAKNTSATIATAAPRMAATRAKGRALRDALNIGTTMYEELPDAKIEEAPATPYANSAIKDPNAKRQPQAPLQAEKSSRLAERQEWLDKWQVLVAERQRLIGLGYEIAEVLVTPQADAAEIRRKGKELSAAIKAGKAKGLQTKVAA